MACCIFLNQQVKWKYASLTAFESLSVTLCRSWGFLKQISCLNSINTGLVPFDYFDGCIYFIVKPELWLKFVSARGDLAQQIRRRSSQPYYKILIKSGQLWMSCIHNLSAVMSFADSDAWTANNCNSSCVLIMYCMFKWYVCGTWKMESDLEKSEKFALAHEGELNWQIMAFFSLDWFVQSLYFL